MAGIDSFTMLLLHCDGTDASTTFTDSSTDGVNSPHTMTANGNAQIDTAQSKFGTASGLFDGTGDYVDATSSADFGFGTGDFTFDFWIRFATVADTHYFISRTGGSQFIFWFNGSNLFLYNGASNFLSNAWSPSANTWYHLEWDRSGSNNYMFIDGVQQGATTSDSTDYGASGTLSVSNVTTSSVNGWMDEVRISKGIARHTANFTPESSAYSVASTSTNFLAMF
jgi:hypothetical protein